MAENIIEEHLELVIQKKGLIKRDELKKLKSLLNLKQIITITGVRRCGKSILMKETITYLLESKITVKKNIFYLNLENPYFNTHKEDISYLADIYKNFRKTINPKKKVFIFLDEVQFFSDWQVFVKSIYEKDEAKIIITGSNSRLLSPELATLLSGRSIPIHLYPYSFNEFKKARRNVKKEEYLEIGGFPEIAKIRNKENIKLIIEAYYKNIIYQDVIPRFGIKNSLEIENLSYYLLSNTSKEVSYNTLKNISKLDDKTIKNYIGYLEDANLLYQINNYDPSLKKQIGNKKKIYSVDNSFITFFGFSNSPNYGRLLENAVFIELKRREKEIYFYRNGCECDFVIKKANRIVECIQVSKNLEDEKTKKREIDSLLCAMDRFGVNKGLIITENEQDTIKIGEKIVKIVRFFEWAVKD